MTAIIAFVLSPAGRWIVGAIVLLAVLGGVYSKGYYSGWTAHKVKIERQIRDAVEKGTDARNKSLDELNSGRVPDDWFRD